MPITKIIFARRVEETKYQALYQKFPNVGKPTRARLIAMETGLAIPDPVEAILRWLANRCPAPKP